MSRRIGRTDAKDLVADVFLATISIDDPDSGWSYPAIFDTDTELVIGNRRIQTYSVSPP